MKFSQVALAVLVSAGGALVVGCGGGGGGGSAPPVESPQPESATKVKGVAATGAPLSGATIEVKDATGTIVATTVAAEDGSYTLSIPGSAKAPFVITAAKDDIILYSPMASTSVTTVNVTPITTLVAAQLSPTGDPAALASQIEAGTATVDASSVQQVVTAITEALAPLMAAVGAGTVDPISGAFVANGSGYDQALNSLNISINPTGTSSNITITVKAATAEGEQPPEVSFVSGTTPPALPPSVATATLLPPSTDSMIASYLSKLEQCYALPVSERVSGSATVVASACRETFYSNDPATFKHNGSIVSSNQAWSSLWREGSVGTKFSSGNVLFHNSTGEMLVSWRNTSTNNVVSYSRVWLKPQGDSLKAYGNQYNYTFNIRPLAEARDLVNTSVSYYATGFNIDVPNVMLNGTPVFDRVVVTAPSGRITLMRPSGGLSYMVVVNNSGPTGTSIVRLAGKFWNPELSGRQPRQLTGENIVWARNPTGELTDWTDTQIAGMPNIGQWKADYFLAGNTGTTADFTQYAVATTRPLTTAELTQRAFATLTPDLRTQVIAESNATGYVQLAEGDTVDVSADGGAAGWTVPTGAIAPTTVQAHGFIPGTPLVRWNDNVAVSPLQRTAIVPCTPQGSSDPHCSSGEPGTYSGTARLNLVQLIAIDPSEMQWISSFGLFKPTLPQ